MAAMLKKAAASKTNRGLPSSYYAGTTASKPNPVIQAMEEELSLYIAFMKKRMAPGYRQPADEASSRPADTLFELWNKYEARLPKLLYQAKLLEIGDFLVSIREYNLALWQCYGRYLTSFGDINVEEITDVSDFKRAFFPCGFDAEDAGFTFRALMGKSICSYQVIKQTDPKLQNPESVHKNIQLLAFLRLVTQVILPKESLCWLVYNGTIHIYSISRHLMTLGHSSKVLEYLLWASMCMEASVPLLGVRYLNWRTTLYTAVCQVYYDCKASHHAEAFARRALSKINELSQLESMSNSPESLETEQIFRQATVKMAVMVYKRTVFETRRKPKGLLRPKTRANLKDASSLPWPRTPSEKLLAEMFEGSSAQMLCILETLSDSNRRTLLSSPAAPDSEVEILDVTAELFLAAQEIIAGGGGHQTQSHAAAAPSAANIKISGMGGVVKETSLIDMAARGEDGVPLSAVVKIVKLAYCYEQWDLLDSLLDNTISALQEVNEPRYGPDEKALEILHAYDRLLPRSKHRKLFQTIEEEDDGGHDGQGLPAVGKPALVSGNDECIHMAEVLLSVISGPFTTDLLDVDMIVDACLLLWSKCKTIFQRYQTGSTDNPKYLQKMDNPSKWVYVLDIVHQVLGWVGLGTVDPALTAEIVLRLALVYEASAALGTDVKSKSTKKTKEVEIEESVVSSGKDALNKLDSNATPRSDAATSRISRDFSQGPAASRTSMASAGGGTAAASGGATGPAFNRGMRDQLLQAREILELGLQNVSLARQAVALTDGKSIADIGWVKELNKNLFDPEQAPQNEDDSKVNQTEIVLEEKEAEEGKEAEEDEMPKETISDDNDATAVWNTVKDLHLELIFMYHRVCLKLASIGPDPALKETRKTFKRRTCSQMQYASSGNLHQGSVETYEELVQYCGRNSLSKSLLFVQRCLALHGANSTGTTSPSGEQKTLLQDAMALIKKAEVEEKKLFVENTASHDGEAEAAAAAAVKPSKTPPPPILLSRTDTEMVFRPAPFQPVTGEKVAWYRLFARNAAGSNVKVRLNDYFLPGTGEEVPSFRCELRVLGLTPSEKYVFAVAAYTADGQLIGDSVGESTRPILATHPMPVLMTWAYLCQVAYQVGCYPVAKEASAVLWSHFVAKPPPPENITYVTSAQNDFKLTLHRLNKAVVSLASPVLLRMFLTSIFISADVAVKEGALFCDNLCDKGPVIKGQISRLKQCEKMLVALELAGWLNEASLALQAVVQCYGLLAPIIHFKIPSVPVIQVLERCAVVLQEIPANLRQKRTASISESLHHMTACLTYHMARVLRTWGQRSLAANVNDAGRRLLCLNPDKAAGDRDREGEGESLLTVDSLTDTGTLTLTALKKKKGGAKKAAQPTGGAKEEVDLTGNEELKALEAHMLRLSKQAQGEHELTGNEEPSILHAYIAYLPSRLAHKEVAKFRRRARYLEFFVQVAQKGLTEGIPDVVLEWCTETEQWLQKRNEQIIGSRVGVNRQPGALTIIGDDPKKYAAALVEYSKKSTTLTVDNEDETQSDSADNQTDQSPRSKDNKPKPRPTQRGRKNKYKAIGVTPNMTDAQKQAQEELELKALDILQLYLLDMYYTKNRLRKLRKVSKEEIPWRSQLNIVEGLGQFGLFMKKLETREKLTGSSTNYMYSSSFLDQEWFSFETAGTLVVGWNGGPVRLDTQKGQRPEKRVTVTTTEPTKASGIEIAAAAATGKVPPPLFPIPQEDEDTPRTYRSDAPQRTHRPGRGRKEPDPDSLILSAEEGTQLLKKSFDSFKKAVVLAHRGQHWVLLQNACRTMWNCANTALVRIQSPDRKGQPFIAMETLRSLMLGAFHAAADGLLDMLVELQNEQDQRKSSKKVKVEEDTSLVVKSWMGDVKAEKGGASLKFETPLDDLSTVDLRWLKRLVLRALEMLYYEQKWESLADVALRFNGLSDHRFAEQVSPLLVQAQRKLISRVSEHDGPVPPQPQFARAKEQLGGPLTAKAYVNLQLRVELQEGELIEIDPGAHIDPEGHDAYSGGKRALKLSSVPLEFTQSLASLREALDQSQYTARALQHSRQLLLLYLSGQMNVDLVLAIKELSHGQVSRETVQLLTRLSRNLPPGDPPVKIFAEKIDVELANSQQLLEMPGDSGNPDHSHVDFVPGTAQPLPSMPVDLSRQEFLSVDDVQMSPLPRSQISVVMTSYNKTIDLLLAGAQKGLAAEAMKELGSLHYHTGNIRGAYKWWAEALDALLGSNNAIRSWRDTFKGVDDISTAMLEKCGLWGCILGGVLASNIAQYILTSDLGLRTECCFLSAYFFKALFRSSLPHPTADRDYALYEVGEGCEVINLIPGIDLLSERFRTDGRTLVAALRFVMEELFRGRQNLFVLPLLTLYQYFTTFVCRDLQRVVDGRILKVRILIDVGLYTEAFITLQRLLHGERLPHTADSHFRQVESRMTTARFDMSKPLLEPCNLKVLENVVDKRLSSNLGALYGPHLTCHLSLAHAHLLTAVADTVPVLATFDELVPPGSCMHVQPHSISTLSRGGARPKPSIPTAPSKPLIPPGPKGSAAKVDDTQGIDGHPDATEKESSAVTGGAGKRFTGSRRPVTLELVKGTLLSTADQILTTISEVIIENAQNESAGLDGMSASELELVVMSKLELAAIARQRHHSALAARVVLSALRMLQSSNVFKEEDKDRPGSASRLSSLRREKQARANQTSPVRLVQPDGTTQFQYQNFQSRSRLDARLWLQCRLALVQSMMGEIRGMGQVKGEDTKVKVDLQDTRLYCAEGVAEAEACGDTEMEAEFLMQGVLLNTLEGLGVEDTIQVMEDILQLLSQVQQLSPAAQLLQATVLVHQTDLVVAAPSTSQQDSFLTDVKLKYCTAQSLLLAQLEQLGEKIEQRYDGRQEYSTPASPLRNLYLPHLLLLTQVKLRTAHTMARAVTKVVRERSSEEACELWAAPLGVATTAFELCKVISQRVASLEAEILLLIGKIQRQLVHLGKISHHQVAGTLLEAIKTSYAFDHDLGLMRQSYLELCILYLASSGQISVKDGSVLEPVVPDIETESVISKDSTKKKRQSRTSKGKKDQGQQELPEGEKDKEKRAAWIALRCAAAAGQAQRAHAMLIGDPSITSVALSTKAQESLPDFLCLDLMAPYVLGEKKRVYENEIEEELAPLTEALDPPPVETYDDQLNKAREATKDLSWIHIIGYQMILKRLCSTATVTTTTTDSQQMDEENKNNEAGDLGPEFDLGFISHAQLDIGLNHNLVRSVLFSTPWQLRLNYMHQCLVQQLPKYADDCSAIYPPNALSLGRRQPDKMQTGGDLELIIKSYSGNMSVPLDVLPDGTLPKLPSAPGTQENLHKPSSKAVQTVETEVCLQWYQPSLNEHSVTVTPDRDDQGEPITELQKTRQERQIMLLYTVGKKPDRIQAAMMWVSLTQLVDLHDRLTVLTQRGEISLVDKVKLKKEPSATSLPAKGKKQARIKALSAKVKRDEHLEALLKQCMSEVQTILGYVPEPEPPKTPQPPSAENSQTKLTRSNTSLTNTVTEDSKPDIPFEVTKANMYSFERLFDPSYGSCLREGKLLTWLAQMFP